MSNRAVDAIIKKKTNGRTAKYQLIRQKDGTSKKIEDTTLGSAPSYVISFPYSQFQPKFEDVVDGIKVHKMHHEDVEATKAARQFFHDHRTEFNLAQLRFPTPRWKSNDYFTLLPNGSVLTMRDADRVKLIVNMVDGLQSQGQEDLVKDILSNWLIDFSCPNPFVPRLFRFEESDSPVLKTEGINPKIIHIRQEIARDEMLANLYDDRMIHPIPLSKKSSLGFDKLQTKFGCSSKMRNFNEYKAKDELLKRGVSPEQIGLNTVKYTLLDKIKIILSGWTMRIFLIKLKLFWFRYNAVKAAGSDLADGMGKPASFNEVYTDLSLGVFNVGLTGWRKNNWDEAINADTGEPPTVDEIMNYLAGKSDLRLITKERAAVREVDDFTLEEGTTNSKKLEKFHSNVNGHDKIPGPCTKWRQVTGFPHADQFVPEAIFISQTAHKIDISQIGYPTTSADFKARIQAIEQLERNNVTEHLVVDRSNCDHQYTECAHMLDQVCPKGWYWWISRHGYVILQSEKGCVVLCRSLTSGHYDTADKNSKWGRESVVEIICKSLNEPLDSDFAIWFRKSVSKIRRESLDFMDEHGHATGIQLGVIKFLFNGFEYRYYVIDGKDDQIIKVCHDKGAPNLFNWVDSDAGKKWSDEHKLKIKRITGENYEVSFGFNVFADHIEENDSLTANRFPFHEKTSWGLAIMHRMSERLKLLPAIFIHCFYQALRFINAADGSYDTYSPEFDRVVSTCKMDPSLFEDEYGKIARSDPDLQEDLVGHVPNKVHHQILNMWRTFFNDPRVKEDYVDPLNYKLIDEFKVN